MVKIAIVGADGTKWKEEQIPKAKKEIEIIFAKHACVNSLETDEKGEVNGLLTIMNVLGNYDNLTLVSGHCSVGIEKWYCIDCKVWFGNVRGDVFLHDTHKIVRVFDQGGVGTWAEIIATELGIKKEIYPAEVNQWNDKYTDEEQEGVIEHLLGYRSRNIQIARACDVLYDIEPTKSCRHCGGRGKIYATLNGKVDDFGFTCKFCEGDGAGSGGTWTKKRAESLGREVHKVII